MKFDIVEGFLLTEDGTDQDLFTSLSIAPNPCIDAQLTGHGGLRLYTNELWTSLVQQK